MGLKVITDILQFWPSFKQFFIELTLSPALKKNKIYRNSGKIIKKIHFFRFVPKSPIQIVSLSRKTTAQNLTLGKL
jgi:hypothetical protein